MIIQVNTVPNIVEQFHFTHSTNHDHAAYLKKHLVFNDRYDNLLYEAAKKIFSEEVEFAENLKNYNISLMNLVT